MILDPITQAAVAIQRTKTNGLGAQASAVIPESFGHRVVDGFTIWVSQQSAPALAQMTDVLSTFDKVNVADGETVTIGSKVYTFQTTLTNVDGHVHIGASYSDSLTNLLNAVNVISGVPGTDYAAATVQHADVIAGSQNGSVTITAKAAVTDSIAVSTTSAHLKWDTPTLVASNTVAGQLIHQVTAAPLLAGATKATFAVALGYSLLPPADRTNTKVLRIWADSELVYDATNPNAAPQYYDGMTITFHEGSPNAEPDALIAADMGALAPGFRNMMYVVFKDFSLQVGPTPTAPPPTVTQPVPVVTRKVLPYPGICPFSISDPLCYNAGDAWFGPGVGTGTFYLKSPPNAAYPGGGFGGHFISWINDSQSRTGKGGGYDSLRGTVNPYPVDIGNGITVIAGNEGVDATIESTTQDPATISQAPAPEPSYRTNLPRITVELADALPVTPIVTPYQVIDLVQLPGGFGAGDGVGGFVDWDMNYIYQWTNDSGFVTLHVYSMLNKIELARFAPATDYVISKGTPEAIYNSGCNVHFDFWSAHDKVNKLVFTNEWNSNAGSETATSTPIIMVDLQTGQVKGAVGARVNSGEVDGVQTITRASGDCVTTSGPNGLGFGLVTGGWRLPYVGYTRYTTLGGMTSGGHIVLDNTNSGTTLGPSSVLGYPLVNRADLKAQYGLSSTSQQDWYCYVALGRKLFLVHGNATSIVDSNLVYTADHIILATFIDPNDRNVILIKEDSGSLPMWMEKLRIDTTLTPTGIAPVFTGSVYNKQLPNNIGTDALIETSLRESLYTSGQLVYPGGGSWNTVDLASGEVVSIVADPGVFGSFTNNFVYNGGNGTAIAVNASGAAPMASVQLLAGLGAPIKMSDVLSWLGQRGGYTGTDISIDPTINDTVLGGCVDNSVLLWGYLQNLATVFNFNYFESEGKLKFMRGVNGDSSSASATVDINLLSTADGSAGDLKENIITTLAAPVELASAVEVGYRDAEFNFQPNTKSFQRARFPYRDAKPGTTASYETYLCMTGTDALNRAAATAFANYAEGVVQNLKLPFQFGRMEPGDTLNLIIDGTSFLVSFKEVNFGLDWSLAVTATNFNYKNNVLLRADAPLGQQQNNTGPSDSLPCAIESTLPSVADDPGQDAVLVITGVESLGQPWWNGAAMNVLAEGEADWTRIYFTNQQTPYGQTILPLPATDTPFRTADINFDVLAVSISGASSTGSLTDLWAGTNAAYVGQPGRWELIYYESVTWVNAKRFTVNKVLRGRRGTEIHCNDHVSGDLFIPFNRRVMQMYPAAVSKLNKLLSFSAVGQGTTKSAAVQTNVLDGNSLKPWAITYVKASFL